MNALPASAQLASSQTPTGTYPTGTYPEHFDGIHFQTDPRYGEHYIRGRNLLSYEDARGLMRSLCPVDDFGVFWGGLYLPSAVATNFTILGIPGSGKTTLIRLMMQSVLPLIGLKDKSRARAQLLDPNYYAARFGSLTPEDFPAKVESHRAMIFDVKQEYLSYLGGMNLNGPVLTVNPFLAGSCLWETGKDVSAKQIRTFSKIFIPDTEGGSEHSPFFRRAARNVVSLVVEALRRQRGDEWTFLDFHEVMSLSVNYERLINSYEDLRQIFSDAQRGEKTFNNVVQEIQTHVQEIEPAAKAWRKSHHKFSIRDWLNGESILVLSRDEEDRHSIDPIYRLIFGVAAGMAISGPDKRDQKTWFFLDELGNAGELTNLTELMTMGRSKGCSVVLGAQGLPTLRRAFVKKDAVDEILEMCPYTAILRAGGPETAEWAEKQLGKCEFYENKQGHSLANAYTSGHSTTRNESEAESVSKSRAVGTTRQEGASQGEGRSYGTGTNWNRSEQGSSYHGSGPGGSSGGSSIGWGMSNGGSTNSTNSYNTGTNTSQGESETITDTAGRTITKGNSVTEQESHTRTDTESINRERLEKSLVHSSQILSLKTLQYDGMLLGYFLSPFGTYSAALPGEYVALALQPVKSPESLSTAAPQVLPQPAVEEERAPAVERDNLDKLDERLNQLPSQAPQPLQWD